jgi:integrase
MPLTARQVETTRTRSKLFKLSDGGGLQLWVMPNGSKLWRLAYRYGGKQKLLALGRYPTLSLADARELREVHRKTLAKELDPALMRKTSRQNTFSAVADQWIAQETQAGRAAATIKKSTWILGLCEATLGPRPIDQIRPVEIMAVIEALMDKGVVETAIRARSVISGVFQFATGKGMVDTNPAKLLKVSRPEGGKVKHHAAIVDAVRFGELLRVIDTHAGDAKTRLGLLLCALTAARPGEMRKAEWSEFDLEKALWEVPAERMKQRVAHAAPLSRQAVALLRELRAHTEGSRLLFPTARDPNRPVSDNTWTMALRRLGFTAKEMTVHGFRTSFSSMANEADLWSPDAIERHLSHRDSDTIRGTYARSPYWSERERLAQWWADRCDLMRHGADVVPLRRGA